MLHFCKVQWKINSVIVVVAEQRLRLSQPITVTVSIGLKKLTKHKNTKNNQVLLKFQAIIGSFLFLIILQAPFW